MENQTNKFYFLWGGLRRSGRLAYLGDGYINTRLRVQVVPAPNTPRSIMFKVGVVDCSTDSQALDMTNFNNVVARLNPHFRRLVANMLVIDSAHNTWSEAPTDDRIDKYWDIYNRPTHQLRGMNDEMKFYRTPVALKYTTVQNTLYVKMSPGVIASSAKTKYRQNLQRFATMYYGTQNQVESYADETVKRVAEHEQYKGSNIELKYVTLVEAESIIRGMACRSE